MVKSKLINKIAGKLIPHRIWVQTLFLAVWASPLRFQSMCSPVFHCYACPLATFACPIGIMAQFSALHLFPFMALGVLIVTGSLFGSLVCGWACPFGFLQDLLAKIPTKKFVPPVWIGYFRYVILLVAVLAVPYFFGKDSWLFVCRICPAGFIEDAMPDIVSNAAAGKAIVWPNAIKISVVVLFLAAIFFVRRPWCKVLCPLGAIFGLFNRFSVFSMRFDEDGCTECNICHKKCTHGLEPAKSIEGTECIRCLQCLKCPPKALTLETLFDTDKKTEAAPDEQEPTSDQ